MFHVSYRAHNVLCVVIKSQFEVQPVKSDGKHRKRNAVMNDEFEVAEAAGSVQKSQVAQEPTDSANEVSGEVYLVVYLAIVHFIHYCVSIYITSSCLFSTCFIVEQAASLSSIQKFCSSHVVYCVIYLY